MIFVNTSSASNKSKSLIEIMYMDIQKITTMDGMFGFCENLIEVNSSNWNTSNVTDMRNMFADCWSLNQIRIPKNISSSTNITDITVGRFAGSDGNAYPAGTFPKGNSTSITLTAEPA